jgi:glycosyltransferase involved in cell wall biosynthesis
MITLQPLVSCILPTADRLSFIPLAISYFLRQDYPNAELIIVDDGIRSAEHLIPALNNIHYERAQGKATIGAKRNMACQKASGDIILHWDDDDWYHKSWITHQVNTLTQTGADLCGLDNIYFYAPAMAKGWKYIYPPNMDKPWVGGATMAYRKEIWRQYPFKDIQVGEDNDFVWMCGGKVHVHGYTEGFVSIIHANNTSPKYTQDSRWVITPADEIKQLLQTDIIAYGS